MDRMVKILANLNHRVEVRVHPGTQVRRFARVTSWTVKMPGKFVGAGKWCWRPDLNRHASCEARDFKSRVSACSTTPARETHSITALPEWQEFARTGKAAVFIGPTRSSDTTPKTD